MSINAGQLSSGSLPALSTSTSALLCTVPPGVGTVVVSNTCGGTVYVTAGVAASSTNGFAIPNNAPPVNIPTYPGSKGTTLNVIVATGTSITGSVSWLISSGQ